MAYAMRYARHEDMTVLRRHVSDDDIREALDKAPAGIIDPRSWAYWNSKMGRYPPPPLPARSFAAMSGGIGINDTGSARGVQSSRELSLEDVREEGSAE